MNIEIKNDYIEKALNELVSIVGVKEFIGHQKILSLIHSKKIEEGIKAIALYLGLPIDIRISYVAKGYRPSANDGFQSTHLVKTNWRGGGNSGITAQVSIPSDLPLYRALNMVNFPINVRLSENCAEKPETLITVMAHELSHIVLYSVRHKEKENEFYTDLTAMLLGFGNVMKLGRKVTKTSTSTEYGVLSNKTTTRTETTTYGYLSDENFNFAFKKIERALKKRRGEKEKFVRKLKKFKKELAKAKNTSFRFRKYLEYVDKNTNQKISPEDGLKISSFHQFGYSDDFEAIIKKGEKNIKTFSEFAENLDSYNKQNMEMIQQYKAQLKSITDELAEKGTLLQKDVGTLKKYVSLFYKIKLKFNL